MDHVFLRRRSNQGPPPQKVTQSKSMSAMPVMQPPPPSSHFEADQHTYQNHRPNFPPQPPGGAAGPPQNRSTSVGNLTMPRAGPGAMPPPHPMNGGRFPSQQDIAGGGFDQGYYQNVGGGHNGHTAPQLQQHMPLR